MSKAAETLNHKTHILLKGARVHNLKNIDVAIAKNKLTVITGLSGSGKSSLAFDTLYAEGQRRYVESLSSYARQFMGKLEKPDIDGIRGIAPAIAIEQKVNSKNPRSTVGTTTEIYDYLKLLFARVGNIISPISGEKVKKDSLDDVANFILSHEEKTKVVLLSKLWIPTDRTLEQHSALLQDQGFTRIYSEGKIIRLSDGVESISPENLYLLIDRFTAKQDNDNISRIYDSIQTAFTEGNGECMVQIHSENIEERTFSNKLELDGLTFEEPVPNLFSANNPLGACPVCEGFGSVLGIDEDLVIPKKSLSVYEDAIACWRGETMGEWKKQLLLNAHHFDFPIHRSINELTKAEYKLLWKGNKYFEGLDAFFKHIESQMYKVQYRVMMSRYRGKTKCPDCEGEKLKKEAQYVKIGGLSITEIAAMNIDKCKDFFDELTLSEYDLNIAERLLIEIKNRLQFLSDVGLGYLTINRLANTLSGGESQRINLATSLGSSLVGSMYILDEPSIGLHPRDTQRLIKVLKSLRDLGNTVIVVEHDEEIMQAADEIIDIGPMAGVHGGEIVFQGVHQELLNADNSLTAQYLTGKVEIEIPLSRRKWNSYIEVSGARENNLKNIDVKLPLNIFTVITGVSGSGKSTLIKKIVFPHIKRQLDGYKERPGEFDDLSGDVSKIKAIEFIDQNPIGKSSRSNPVTYVKAFDEIRKLYSVQQLSKISGYKPKHFSFNVEGGRCDTCEGDGQIRVEMQFMADIFLTCDECGGKRFKDDVLEVKYHNKSIHEVLELTIDEALEFFAQSVGTSEKKIINRLQPLQDVGLGYVKLGQPSSTLSGGEAQRIKLASFLGKDVKGDNTLFIFDEPSTGLHFHDVEKLLKALNALVEKGHSVMVIEHHADIIKSADWIIDLGKEGGDEGGNIVFEGVPEDIIKDENSYTGFYLREKF